MLHLCLSTDLQCGTAPFQTVQMHSSHSCCPQVQSCPRAVSVEYAHSPRNRMISSHILKVYYKMPLV